jgi:hypothetical protein
VKPVAALRVGVMHDQRLQDAALADVVGEFVELGVGEVGAWVARVFVHRCSGDEHRRAGARHNCAQQGLRLLVLGARNSFAIGHGRLRRCLGREKVEL